MKLLGEFDGYTLREPEESDYDQLEQWIAADAAHREILDPEFFMGQALNEHGHLAKDLRSTCAVLERKGEVLFYIRLTRAARVNIQFPPGQDRQRQTALALVKGMAFLEVGLERAGAEEWIFETQAPALRKLAEKGLGFVPSPDELVRIIPRLPRFQEETEVA
jgi:hypothetical protein